MQELHENFAIEKNGNRKAKERDGKFENVRNALRKKCLTVKR